MEVSVFMPPLATLLLVLPATLMSFIRELGQGYHHTTATFKKFHIRIIAYIEDTVRQSRKPRGTTLGHLF